MNVRMHRQAAGTTAVPTGRQQNRLHRSSVTRPTLAALGLLTAGALLAGCSAGGPPSGQSGSEGTQSESAAPAEQASGTVTIEDNHGQIEVPVNPERVVALDNTTFQTLSDWGVELAAAPKGVMGQLWPEYTQNEAVLDVGNHGEPNLEAVIEADPELIIGGYRFAKYYDDLKKIQPVTIEINAREGEDHVAEMKRQAQTLGQIFDREQEAQELATQLDQSISEAKSAYNGEDTVVGLITSGGKIAYAAPGEGRGVGLLFPTLGLKPGIEQAAEDTSHGDEISVEAIAQANPEWLVVLDRDGALEVDDYVPAKELIEQSEALKEVPAVKKGQIIYLDPNFYLDEGIQAYTKLFNQVAEQFAAAQKG